MQLKKRSLILGGGIAWLGMQGTASWAAEVLPTAPQPFNGKIDVSRDKSTPAWPEAAKAPKGAPNVVLILLDDVGFGATSTFGGPTETPTLERVANEGLRFNQFHVNAMCSPTRASLLTGRNNHQVGFGRISEFAAGYPGYDSVIGRDQATIAEVLKLNGYSTAAFGKWHNTPVWEINAAGPFDRWPTGLGFEYFYGFMAAATSQWEPSLLYRNTVPVEAPAKPDQGYHLTTDLANDAIKWLHQHDAVAPDKPFFLYFATGGAHEPLHAPQEWIDKYKGKFDQGWDKLREEIFTRQKALGVIPANAELTPRPAGMPAWASLTPEQKQLLAHQAEVYAGFLAHTDHEVGRVLKAIKEEGKDENTLVLYIVGDNGASLEGGLLGRDARSASGAPADVANRLARSGELGSRAFGNHYATPWAWATNTPFQWGKQVASHLGGIRDPLVVSWPARIKDKGGLRSQFTHVIDIAPTLYEVAGIEVPEVVNGVKQAPLEGISLAYAFDQVASQNRPRTQYFEMLGNLGIYKDGWFAGRRFQPPWEVAGKGKFAENIDKNPWELYHLAEDYSQAHDLAAQNPGKLKELLAVFDQEAKRNNVYPIAPREQSLPSAAASRTSFTFRDGAAHIPARTAPSLSGRSHTITANVEIPINGAEGVIFAQGGRQGGFSLYVKDGKLFYENNSFGVTHDKIIASNPLPSGKVVILFDYIVDEGSVFKDLFFGWASSSGRAQLSVNGKSVGQGRFDHFGPFGETLDLGNDFSSPVSNDYVTPFTFTGKVEKIHLELK